MCILSSKFVPVRRKWNQNMLVKTFASAIFPSWQSQTIQNPKCKLITELTSLTALTFHENSPYERQKRRWTRASRNTDVPDLKKINKKKMNRLDYRPLVRNMSPLSFSPTPEERRPDGRERRKSTLKTEQENCVTADCRITAKKRKRAKTTAQCFIE